MRIRRALMGGVYFSPETAEAMWAALEGHGFGYIGVSICAMHGGRHSADVSVMGVSCHFEVDFDTPEEARKFFTEAPFLCECDDADCDAAYIRIGSAAGLEQCLAATTPTSERGDADPS